MQQIDIIKLLQPKSCLIVDDMPTVRTSLKGMLNTMGLEDIETVANSQQAIEQTEAKTFDLVLCDYNLGDGQDGQQLLEELRYRKLLPNRSMFIMITAESARDMVLGALEYQPDDYLNKPITPALLQQRLNRFVSRHEALLPIKSAIDEDNHSKALELCESQLHSGGKYRGSLLKVKGELLLELQHYKDAENHYRDNLRETGPVWVQLGLGRACLAQNKPEEAEQLFRQVIELDERYVEAHDLLAELYEKSGEYQRAQAAMENAARISPKAPLRQRRLASLAHMNNDNRVALQAHKAALKVAEHSCHYSPQDYFDVANGLMSAAHESEAERNRHIADADMYLRRADKKHPGNAAIRMQTAAALSRIHQQLGNPDKVRTYLAQAKGLHQQGQSSAYGDLELAQALRETGDNEAATELLVKIAQQNPHNPDICNRVDGLSDEPITQQGREVAARLNKQGIGHFEKQAFDKSLDVFIRASNLFPRYAGLHLNIIQVALDKLKTAPADMEETRTLIEQHLKNCGKLPETHPQYKRQQHLIAAWENSGFSQT